MAAQILDGKALSAEIKAKVAKRAAELEKQGKDVRLGVIMVGDDPASEIYVRNKQNACDKVGFCSRTIILDKNASQEGLETYIEEMNEDDSVHGILVQLPLPEHLDEKKALALIRPDKDVDGFHVVNAGMLFTGQKQVVPCTPKGIMAMLAHTGIDLDGKEAVVIGRSDIVGKPIAMLLLEKNCTVTICHSHTAQLKEHTRRADILISAVGKPGFVTADMVKPGAVVIDVGINRVDGKVVGDVAFDEVKEVASWITPVPGGVGPMTIAMLMENTLEAAERLEC